MILLGQDTALKYLQQGQQTQRLSPSLLFVGPEGVGKKKTAFILAQSFLCHNKKSSKKETWGGCEECETCHRINDVQHPDLFFVDRPTQATLLKEKPETQTGIKIESIRQMDRFLHLKPLEGRRRIAILDEADKLTHDAANSFLKLLEEPPHNAMIILLATHERNLPTTIRSRCAILPFRNVPAALISRWLQEKFELEPGEADGLAGRSEGSFSRAQALIHEKEEEVELTSLTLEELFETVNDRRWRQEGRSHSRKIIDQLIEGFRKKLEEGDLSQTKPLKTLLAARRQIDQNVTPKLVLENLYLQLTPLK